jgi:hypothetical protein
VSLKLLHPWSALSGLKRGALYTSMHVGKRGEKEHSRGVSAKHILAYIMSDESICIVQCTVYIKLQRKEALTINVPVVYMVRYKVVLRGDYP